MQYYGSTFYFIARKDKDNPIYKMGGQSGR